MAQLKQGFNNSALSFILNSRSSKRIAPLQFLLLYKDENPDFKTTPEVQSLRVFQTIPYFPRQWVLRSEFLEIA